MLDGNYQKYRDDDIRVAYRLTVFLGMVLFPVFGVLDLMTQRQDLTALLSIRIATTASFVLLHALAKRGIYPGPPQFSALFVLALATTSLTAMCLVLGGYPSPYYAGVNLVIVAGALFPWSAAQMTRAAAVVIGIYLSGVVTHAGFTIDQPGLLLNNTFFLFATGIIAVTISALSDRLRHESYLRVIDRQALEARDQFISMASHELKTPLTSMKLQLELLRRSPEAAGLRGDSVVPKLERQLNHLRQTIDEMLDLSRIRAGRFELCVARTDLSALVRETLARHAEDFRARNIALSSKVDDGVSCDCDAFRVEQLLTNLLTNAAKYGAGKPVEARLRAEDGRVLLEVEDKGIGIPPEQRELIFERFERGLAPAGTSGLGLGLFISRQIALGHGGTIEVTSEPGAGSTFRFVLPRR